MESRLIFDVSGIRYETSKQTIQRFPDTLLGDIKRRTLFLDKEQNRYFFNRNRSAFESILFFYQSNGRLICPANVTFSDFIAECNFFEIPESYVNSFKLQNNIVNNKDENMEEIKQSAPVITCREKIWNILEHSSTSKKAWLYGLWSMVALIFSVTTMCLETSDVGFSGEINYNDTFYTIEFWQNVWFLSEIVLKITFCPNKIAFLKNPFQQIDLVIVIPYFIIYFVDTKSVHRVRPFKLLRSLKLSKLFQLSSQSKNYELLTAIISDCINDLQMFFVCLIIIITFGGSIIYSIEKSQPGSLFESIPHSMYFSLQTLVTLGYGDIIPETFAGKIFATLFMVFGAVTLSLPVLSIVLKFTATYTRVNS